MRKVRTLLAVATGVATAYYLDPREGRGRRARAKDQAQAWADRRRRDADRAARYEAGVEAGDEARARGAGRYHPEGERDLHEHLRMVIANLPVPTSDVTVEVHEGVARLRGQVRERSHVLQVVEAVRNTPGVAQVESLLHLPGEPAPNKAAALQASQHATGAAGPGGTGPTEADGPR